MDRTPGVIIPSSYSSVAELRKDLKRRDKEAGFTTFDPDVLAHSSSEVDIFLEHYGVKGMHWGQRKAKIQKTAKRKTKQYQANRKAKSKRQIIVDRRRQLSEGDLKKFVERLQTEKKLKDLIEADIKPGRSVSKRILSDSGQKIARTVIAGGGLILVKAAVDKKMGTKLNSDGEKVDLVKENLGLLTDHIKLKLKKGKGG